jgi:hypothetical protein
LIVGALGCAASGHDAELPTGHIRISDASGTTTQELRATSYGYVLRPDGIKILVANGLVDAGEARFEKGKLWRRAAPRATSEVATVEREKGHVQVFDGVRAPLGQIVERDGKTWVYDPGGTPLGSAKTDKDRVVLVDRDGASRGFVTGLPEHAAAAFLLGRGLGELDRVVLAIALART